MAMCEGPTHSYKDGGAVIFCEKCGHMIIKPRVDELSGLLASQCSVTAQKVKTEKSEPVSATPQSKTEKAEPVSATPQRKTWVDIHAGDTFRVRFIRDVAHSVEQIWRATSSLRENGYISATQIKWSRNGQWFDPADKVSDGVDTSRSELLEVYAAGVEPKF